MTGPTQKAHYLWNFRFQWMSDGKELSQHKKGGGVWTEVQGAWGQRQTVSNTTLSAWEWFCIKNLWSKILFKCWSSDLEQSSILLWSIYIWHQNFTTLIKKNLMQTSPQNLPLLSCTRNFKWPVLFAAHVVAWVCYECTFFFTSLPSPWAHLHVVGMLWFMSDISQPSLPTPFYSVLVSTSVFKALSTVFHSMNFPNSPFSHSVLQVLCLPYWSLSIIWYLLMKVSFNPDIVPSGWLGSKHQLTN